MVDGETAVTLSMKQLLSGIAALILLSGGVLWAVLAFTIGGMRDDLRTIRDSIVVLQKADRDTVIRGRDLEVELIKQVAGLRMDIATLRTDLDKAVGVLKVSVEGLHKDFTVMQASWNDPGRVKSLIEELGKAGIDREKVIIVPMPGPIPQQKQFMPIPR